MTSGRDVMMDNWRYGNPLDILIRAEEKTCKGCKWKHTDIAFGEELSVCTYVRHNGTRPNYQDKRCKHYREGRSNGIQK